MFSFYGTERIKGHNKWKVLSDTFSNLDGHILAGKKKYSHAAIRINKKYNTLRCNTISTLHSFCKQQDMTY